MVEKIRSGNSTNVGLIPQSAAQSIKSKKVTLAGVEMNVDKISKLLQMKKIPGGTFIMGVREKDRVELTEMGYVPDEDEMHPQQVTLTDFELATYEVTQELFELVMGYNPSRFKGKYHPVESLEKFEAQEFCLRLTYVFSELSPAQKAKLETWARTANPKKSQLRFNDDWSRPISLWFSRPMSLEYKQAMLEYAQYAQTQKGFYQLPTEAQWEYAARGGSRQFLFATPNGEEAGIEAVGNHYYVTNGAHLWLPGNVGMKQPNVFGIYDLFGNAGEMCSDYFVRSGDPTYASKRPGLYETDAISFRPIKSLK